MRIYLIKFSLLLICSLFAGQVASQTFPCDGALYLTQNNRRPPTELNKITFENNSVQFNKVTEYSVELNAIGFNPNDNYLYGFEKGTLAIHQLRRDGSSVKVGNAQDYESNNCASGAFTNEGVYIIQDRQTDKLHFYQINPSFSKINEVLLTWSPTSGNSGICDVNFDDIVVDPNDEGRLITYQRNYTNGNAPANTEGQILAINIDFNSSSFGEVSAIGYVSGDVILQLGSMFFGNDGLLYGYGAKDQNFTQKHLVALNINNPSDSKYVASGPLSENTDGCSCPVRIEFKKAIESIEQKCDSIYVEYRFTLINNSSQQFSGLTLFDELPHDGNFNGNIVDKIIWGTSDVMLSADKSTLTVSDLSILALDTLTFKANVRYSVTGQTISNQAIISGFNSLVGDEVLSDDPMTDLPLDPTSFTISQPNETIRDTIVQNLCEGDSIAFSGQVLSKSGFYSDTLSAINGCDSIFTLNLRVRPIIREQVSADICSGTSYNFNGTTIHTSGNYIDTLSTAEGCDSIVEIELRVLPPIEQSIERTICHGDSIQFNGLSISNSGTYSDTLRTTEGCDSIINLKLSVSEELNVSATSNYITDHCTVLQADIQPGFTVDSIFWSPSTDLSCSNCLNPEIYAENDQNYLVTLYNEDGCSVEVPISIQTNGADTLDHVYIPNIFTPHNRDDLNDHFTLFSSQCIALIEEMRIYDRWGNLVFEQHNVIPSIAELGWNGHFHGKKASTGVYVYYFKVRNFDGSTSEYYGDVTLH